MRDENGGEAYDPKGRLGTLSKGSVADLVLVDGDPLRDITVLQDHSKLTVLKSPVSVVSNFGNTGLVY